MNKNTMGMLLLLLLLNFTAFAHDEGHGPKLSDSGKFGGLMAPLIFSRDSELGAKAEMQYKAELVRSMDGTLRLYVYDKNKTAQNIEKWKPQAEVQLLTTKGKKTESQKFTIKITDSIFMGKMPKPKTKPYSLDFLLNDGKNELLVAFDNLD